MAATDVVRIPIAGPAPFNTLVIVQTPRFDNHKPSIADGRLHRATLTVGTAFVLAGNDPRVEPAFAHSSVAALTSLAQADDAAFTIAVDSVSGRFAVDGRWMLDLQTASLRDHEPGLALLSFSSWILCCEAR